MLSFDTPGADPILIANCLARPTSMVLHEKKGTLYITEFAGSLKAVSVSTPMERMKDEDVYHLKFNIFHFHFADSAEAK